MLDVSGRESECTGAPFLINNALVLELVLKNVALCVASFWKLRVIFEKKSVFMYLIIYSFNHTLYLPTYFLLKAHSLC